MSKPSLFARISKAFLEPAERSIEDIDHEVEAAVHDIQSAVLETLDGASVLGQSTVESGDTFFILDLAPFYNMIGGHDGRLAGGVAESCNRVFAHYAQSPADRGTFEGDFFMMLFHHCPNEEGFGRAAIIVNEIGKFILSDRFETMEVPDLLVAVKAKDVLNRDGTINLERMEDKVIDGGIYVPMDTPPKDAPHWVKLRHERQQEMIELQAIHHKSKDQDLEWTYAERNGNALKARSMRERRRVKITFVGTERRKAFDRRGRGY